MPSRTSLQKKRSSKNQPPQHRGRKQQGVALVLPNINRSSTSNKTTVTFQTDDAMGSDGLARSKSTRDSYTHGLFFQSKPTFKTTQSGLTNLGNTCFFNSVMQVMSCTDILHDLLDEPDTPPYHTEDIELRKQCPATESDEVGELTTAFRTLMRLLWIQKGGTITPRTLFTRIGMTNRQFMGYQQQDSHELLRVLLDALETEELALIHKLHPETQKPRRRKRRSQTTTSEAPKDGPKSFVDLVFGGRLASTTICDACKHISTVYEDFLDLSLPIKADGSMKIRKRDRLRVALRASPTRFRRSLSPLDLTGSLSADEGSTSRTTKRSLSTQTSTSDIEMMELSGDDSAASEDNRSKSSGRSRENPEPKSNRNSLDGPRPKLKAESDDHLHRVKQLLHEDQGSLHIRHEYSLKNCLRRFTAVEVLDGDNSFACENCWKLQNGSADVESDSTSDDSDTSDSVDRYSNVDQGTNTAVPNIEISQMEDDPAIPSAEAPADAASVSSATFAGNETDIDSSSVSSVRDDDTLADNLALTSIDDTNTSFSSALETSAASLKSPSIGRASSARKSTRKAKYVLQKAYRRYLLAELPRVLVIHFKRFEQTTRGIFGSLKKADDFVRFPEMLDVESFMVPPNSEAAAPEQPRVSTRYRLYGAVLHMGSMNSGHYVAFVLSHKVEDLGGEIDSKERRWIHCSDTTTRPATWEEVSKAKVYLLFYERV